MDKGQQEALNQAISDIKKRYGEGAIMRLGEAHHLQVEAIPTGALSLDIALRGGRCAPRAHHGNLRPRIFG